VADEVAPMRPRQTTERIEPPCPITGRCFAAGTLVATATGLVPIESVEVGDHVYAFDDATGQERLAQVVALHHRDVEEVWVLRIGDQVIETTDEHPFYVAERGWTEASRLDVGDAVILSGGERLPVVGVQRVPESATVYNFEVEGLHSYFVGELGVVVHNCRSKLNTTAIGNLGEEVVIDVLRGKGYRDIVQIQNASGHGIDVFARSSRGDLRFFEVKSSLGGKPSGLSRTQRDLSGFVQERLERVARAQGQWKNVSPEVRRAAIEIRKEIARGMEIKGVVVRVSHVRNAPVLRYSIWRPIR
jgi:Holliday junction resolvase-like predicted endonuclease